MTEPFRPSNATQADAFFADFCNKCKRGSPHVFACNIVNEAMQYKYPKEWIAHDDGSATCTAFEVEA